MKTRRLHRGMQPADRYGSGGLAEEPTGVSPYMESGERPPAPAIMDRPAAGLNPTFAVPHDLALVGRAYGRPTGASASRRVGSGALAFHARAPIGSQAGREMAGSSRAFRYSSGSMLLGTATSYTNSVNQSSLIVK